MAEPASPALAACGLCADFPCERLWAFKNDGRLHHEDILIELANLRQKGPELWLEIQANRWRCRCGESYSWYEETCHACGQPLASYGADPALAKCFLSPGPQNRRPGVVAGDHAAIIFVTGRVFLVCRH